MSIAAAATVVLADRAALLKYVPVAFAVAEVAAASVAILDCSRTPVAVTVVAAARVADWKYAPVAAAVTDVAAVRPAVAGCSRTPVAVTVVEAARVAVPDWVVTPLDGGTCRCRPAVEYWTNDDGYGV
jgi:hypothetical protein